MTHAEQNLTADAKDIDVSLLIELVTMETSGALTATQAKAVAVEMVNSRRSPSEIAAAMGFEAVDVGQLDALIDELIAANDVEWQRFCEGDPKMTGFFVGQIMRATQGNADGKTVTAILNQRKG